MTLQGIDQQGRISDWQRAKALGKAYSITRLVGENGAVDLDYGPNTTGAEAVGIVPGGYHFIAHGTARAHCRIFVDAMGDPAGSLVMVDVETPNAHPTPTAADVAEWFDEYRSQVPTHPVILYSRANFWASIGNPTITDPHTVLMTSGYPGGSAYPGDTGGRWGDRYGGLAPRFWQYAGSTDLGLGAAVDLSAFKGTLDELRALAASQEGSMNLVPLVYLTAVVPLVGKPVLDAPGGTLIYKTKAGDRFPEVGDTGSYHVMRMPGNIAGYIAHGNVAPSVPLPPPVRPADPTELATARAAGRESFRTDVVALP